jgi:hypothetical protein
MHRQRQIHFKALGTSSFDKMLDKIFATIRICAHCFTISEPDFLDRSLIV